MNYVLIIGPYDSTVVGPFSTELDAQTYSRGVPTNFDAYVYTKLELDANFAQFGAVPIQSPSDTLLRNCDYAFGGEQ